MTQDQKDDLLAHTLRLLLRAKAVLESCTGFGAKAEEARQQLLQDLKDTP